MLRFLVDVPWRPHEYNKVVGSTGVSMFFLTYICLPWLDVTTDDHHEVTPQVVTVVSDSVRPNCRDTMRYKPIWIFPFKPNPFSRYLGSLGSSMISKKPREKSEGKSIQPRCGWWLGPILGGAEVWGYHPKEERSAGRSAGWLGAARSNPFFF